MAEKLVGLFGDAANLYGDARDGNVRLDYAAALQHARRLGKLVHANLYAVRCNGDKDKGFLVAMKNIGFTRVVARHPRIRPDGQIKSDLDTALTMDVTQAALAGEVDVVVILSGDSDFTYLVERLVERGIPVALTVGGDGTINEVANGLLDQDTTRLAIVRRYGTRTGSVVTVTPCLRASRAIATDRCVSPTPRRTVRRDSSS